MHNRTHVSHSRMHGTCHTGLSFGSVLFANVTASKWVADRFDSDFGFGLQLPLPFNVIGCCVNEIKKMQWLVFKTQKVGTYNRPRTLSEPREGGSVPENWLSENILIGTDRTREGVECQRHYTS